MRAAFERYVNSSNVFIIRDIARFYVNKVQVKEVTVDF